MLNGMLALFFALAQKPGGPQPPFWFFVIFFAAIWIFVAFLISRVGGWNRLAECYRTDQPFFGTMYRLQAAQMRRGTNYNGCLNFGVNSDGLYLVPMALFRAFHAPLFIPWSEITARPIKMWRWWNFVELRFRRAPEVPVKIRSSLAEKLAMGSTGRFKVDAEKVGI